MNEYIPSNVNVQNALGAYYIKESLKADKSLHTFTDLAFYNSTKVIREIFSSETIAYKIVDKNDNLNLIAIVDKPRGIIYNVRTYILFGDTFKENPISTVDFIKEINNSFDFIKILIVEENLINYKVYFYTPFKPFYNPQTEIVLDLIERW